MGYAYKDCHNLTGSPVCGKNVTGMAYTYYNCTNLHGNAYFYSNSVSNVVNCFYGRNVSNRLNIYVHSGSTTNTTVLYNDSKSLVGSPITWVDDYSTNGCYYNTSYNIYIYPVVNVAAARLINDFDPEVDLIDFEYTEEDDGTYTLTAWKETYNGEPSVDCVIPNSKLINL